MSGATEDIIEQLESYLDGALDHDRQTALEARLSADPALAAELDARRELRLTRAAAWRSMEPDESAIERLTDGIDRAVRREEIWRRRAAALKWMSAAAASVLLGVGLGWFGRNVMGPQSPVGPAHPAPVAHMPAETPANGFRVALTDEWGNIIAVQQFDSIDRAREFSRDVQQWQQRNRQAGDGAMILVGDRF